MPGTTTPPAQGGIAFPDTSAGKGSSDSPPPEGSRTPIRRALASFSRSSSKKSLASLSGTSTPSPRTHVASVFQPEASSAPHSNVGSRRSSVSKTTASEGTQGTEVSASVPQAPTNANLKALPGHPGNLTKQQAEALYQLVVLLQKDGALHDPEQDPPTHQETQLLRFLRARSFDIDAARTMYLKAEAWKKEIDLDCLCKEFIFEEEEAVAACGWRMYFHKTDKLGRPIFIQDLSNLNTTTLFKATDPDRIIKKFAVTLELAVRHRYEACTESSGRWVDDNMMVVNLAGLGISTFWAMKTQLQQLLAILDNNFPELSGRVQIINAPYMFTSIWSWIKGWLPVATVEKIDIAGGDYLSSVLEYVDAKDWPKHLGGECRCLSDDAKSNGCLRSDVGPWDRSLVSPQRPSA